MFKIPEYIVFLFSTEGCLCALANCSLIFYYYFFNIYLTEGGLCTLVSTLVSWSLATDYNTGELHGKS